MKDILFKKRMNDLNVLLDYLAKFELKPNDLVRICDINPSQMRQYAAGIRTPNDKTIEKINEKIHIFVDKLKEFQITGA